MNKSIVTLFVTVITVSLSNGIRAADISSSNVSNKEDIVHLRQVAEEQQTNAVAWLNYGKALIVNIEVPIQQTRKQLPINAWDQAVRALEIGLRLDDKSFELQRAISRAYLLRANCIRAEDDLTKTDDLKKALYHFSLALSNAPSPFERSRMEFWISHVKLKLDGEDAIAKSEMKLKKQLLEFQKKSSEEKTKIIEEGFKKSNNGVGSAEKSIFASEKNLKRLEEMRKRAQQEPENARALVDYAKMLIEVEYYGMGNTNVFNEASTALKKAIQLDQHNGCAYEWMGHCLDSQGKETDALQYYERALSEKWDSKFIRLRIEAIKRMSQGDGKSDPKRTGSTP